MKHPEDKMVKIFFKWGQVMHMYADLGVIDEVVSHPKFVRFKDDGNDNIFISLEDISGFEVLDDREGSKPSDAKEITQAPESIIAE